MSKISLKSILKKTFKKNKTNKIKKKSKTKKIVKLKTTKKNNKLTKKIVQSRKLLKKKNIKSENKISEQKSDNLRITKNNETKPEIKKVKKQETQKREFKIKDYVVYPKDGVGQIMETKKIPIGGIDVEVYIIKLVQEKVELKFPINKQSLLRPLATINQLNKCISILKSKQKIKRSMWSRRAQEYDAKITSGKIYELAEVVRDLNKGDDLMVEQSYSERQLFEKAYDRLLTEFQIILNVSKEDTQKKLDKALKRNLSPQSNKDTVPLKQTSSNLTDEDAVADNEEELEE